VKDAGVPLAAAKSLVAQLNKAEQMPPAERVKKFNLFKTTIQHSQGPHPQGSRHPHTNHKPE
jgi:hypothetical protein